MALTQYFILYRKNIVAISPQTHQPLYHGLTMLCCTVLLTSFSSLSPDLETYNFDSIFVTRKDGQHLIEDPMFQASESVNIDYGRGTIGTSGQNYTVRGRQVADTF